MAEDRGTYIGPGFTRPYPWEAAHVGSDEVVIYRGGHHVTVCQAETGFVHGVHYNVREDGARWVVGRCANWGGGCPAAVARFQALEEAAKRLAGNDPVGDEWLRRRILELTIEVKSLEQKMYGGEA